MPPRKRLLEKAKGPVTVELEAVDHEAATAIVLLSGIARPPDARLFVFHDDQNRHFIALEKHCSAAGKAIRCLLELPRSYLVAQVLGLTVEMRGVPIGAPPEQVIAKFRPPQAGTAK